jgi:hypothetical protein
LLREFNLCSPAYCVQQTGFLVQPNSVRWTAKPLPPLPMPTPASCASWSAPKATISVRRSTCRRTSPPRSSRRL